MAEGVLQYVKNNFSSGELSVLMNARLDVDKYNQGLSTGENVILLPQGGFTMAWGTQFVAEVKDSSSKTRIEKFQFSTEQAYALEFGAGYIRFFRNHGQIGNIISGAADNGSGLIRITSVGHTLQTGDTIYISGVTGTTEANGFWTVTRVSADTFDLNSSTFTNAYAGGGKWVSETETPYAEEDLFDLQFVQSADVVYIFHAGYATRKLERTSHTSWTLKTVDWVGGPFRKTDPANTITITPSATTGTGKTLTASAALFTADHVGSLWELTHSSTKGYCKVTGFTDSTHVTVDIKKDFGAMTATKEWREGMWSAHRGFPPAGTIHDERLVAGGSPDDPATFAGSVSGSYEDMTDGADDDDAYVFQIGSGEVPSILWFASGDVLLIGTPSGVFKAFGGGNNTSGITPTNVSVKLQTAVGASKVFPVTVESDAFYLQKSRKKIRRLQYSLEADKYVAEDTTVLARHILKPAIVQMAYQSEPFDLVWCVRADGQLVTMTTLESEKVRGFTRRWSPTSATTKEKFESVTVIPEPNAGHDEPWFIVNRTVNEQTRRYVEYGTVTDPEDPDLYSYLDSALTYEGVATKTVSGLSHLEGRTVSIIGDGKVYPTAVVSGGSVTLNGSAASTIRVGIGFTATADTLPIEMNLPDGPSTGRKRKLAQAKLKFVKTLGAAFGGITAQLEEIVFRKGNMAMDSAPPLFTGFKSISNTDWDDEGVIRVQQKFPLPMTVLALSGKLQVGDL